MISISLSIHINNTTSVPPWDTCSNNLILIDIIIFVVYNNSEEIINSQKAVYPTNRVGAKKAVYPTNQVGAKKAVYPTNLSGNEKSEGLVFQSLYFNILG